MNTMTERRAPSLIDHRSANLASAPHVHAFVHAVHSGRARTCKYLPAHARLSRSVRTGHVTARRIKRCRRAGRYCTRRKLPYALSPDEKHRRLFPDRGEKTKARDRAENSARDSNRALLWSLCGASTRSWKTSSELFRSSGTRGRARAPRLHIRYEVRGKSKQPASRCAFFFLLLFFLLLLLLRLLPFACRETPRPSGRTTAAETTTAIIKRSCRNFREPPQRRSVAQRPYKFRRAWDADGQDERGCKLYSDLNFADLNFLPWLVPVCHRRRSRWIPRTSGTILSRTVSGAPKCLFRSEFPPSMLIDV